MKRRWRFYVTLAGRSPVRDFLDELSDAQVVAVLAAMKSVAELGLIMLAIFGGMSTRSGSQIVARHFEFCCPGRSTR
jgi:hypothetical protein